jgi:hypothetical protein
MLSVIATQQQLQQQPPPLPVQQPFMNQFPAQPGPAAAAFFHHQIMIQLQNKLQQQQPQHGVPQTRAPLMPNAGFGSSNGAIDLYNASSNNNNRPKAEVSFD